MRHLRFYSTLGLPVLLVAWFLSGGRVGANAPSKPIGLPQAPVELTIRESAGRDRLPAVPPDRCFEGPLNRLEERLFADAADGRWDEHDLLGAALIASGVDDPSRLDHYQSLVAALVDELRRLESMTGGPRQQAQAILEFLHRRILRSGYQLDSSDLTVALDQGRFNCVSASVLFNCLADACGLTALGLEIPGHAMSRIVLADGTLDVETTCPEWFQLMGDPEKQAALVEKTIGIRYSESAPSAQRRVVSAVELVATIYYNRGVDLLAQKRFFDAAAANAKALRLDPANTTARGNLLATLNNWAIDQGTRGDYWAALETLNQGIALDASYATFKANYVHVHHQWVDELCRQEQFQEAADVLAGAKWRQLDRGYFRYAQLDLCRRWLRACFEAGQIDGAFDAMAYARQQFGPLPELLQQEISELNRQAAVLLEEERFAEAVQLLDRAVAWRPDEPVLVENHRVAVMRWAQPAFQGGDFAEAIRRTTHGGTPGHLHPSLVNNLRYGYYQWTSQLLADGRTAEARRVASQAMADPFLAGRTAGAVPSLPEE